MRAIIIILLFCALDTLADDIKLKDVRLLFQQSSANEMSCKSLMDLLTRYDESNNTTLASYKACATMMMANYSSNPFSKWSYFNSGKNLLEKCILRESTNIESRYLRFTVQCTAPRFLGYDKSIEEDKSFLLNNISKVKDRQLRQMIASFLKSCSYVTPSEKRLLIS